MAAKPQLGVSPLGPGAEIIVVGAGMAGLYFTWRTLRQNPNASIMILEQLPRTGGRLDTDLMYINGLPVKNEEGGMRFTQEMTNLWWLLQTLGSQTMPFSMGDPNNIYHLRGKAFTFGQMANDASLWSSIYNLAPSEQNRQPNEILTSMLKSILAANNNFPPPKTPEDWQNFRLNCTYRSIPLYQWGFWALLADYGMSQECLQMIEDSMGFLAFYDQEVNAGVGFQTMGDFDNLPNYQTLTPGYETLAGTLTSQITTSGTTIINLNTFVDNFTIYDGMISVNTSAGLYLCTQLVLALPSLPLQALAARSPVLRENAQFMADIDTVTSMPLTKINLYFQERWWFNQYKITAGGSFTDMPMGQFYCYEPISNDLAGPASMTIYCDFDRTGYWDALQQLGTPFQATNGWTQPANSTPASSFVVEAAMRQLATFFGNPNLPPPLLSTYVGWGTSLTGDGDHSWKVGVNDQEVMARLQSPVPGEVFTCGEAFSDDQAWVNGALRSTETLLQQQFGLPPYQNS